jgi:hypothetical protein
MPGKRKSPKRLQAAVDLAALLLRVDEGRRAGTVTTDPFPPVDAMRLRAVLSEGEAAGILPDEAAVAKLLAEIARGEV